MSNIANSGFISGDQYYGKQPDTADVNNNLQALNDRMFQLKDARRKEEVAALNQTVAPYIDKYGLEGLSLINPQLAAQYLDANRIDPKAYQNFLQAGVNLKNAGQNGSSADIQGIFENLQKSSGWNPEQYLNTLGVWGKRIAPTPAPTQDSQSQTQTQTVTPDQGGSIQAVRQVTGGSSTPAQYGGGEVPKYFKLGFDANNKPKTIQQAAAEYNTWYKQASTDLNAAFSNPDLKSNDPAKLKAAQDALTATQSKYASIIGSSYSQDNKYIPFSNPAVDAWSQDLAKQNVSNNLIDAARNKPAWSQSTSPSAYPTADRFSQGLPPSPTVPPYKMGTMTKPATQTPGQVRYNLDDASIQTLKNQALQGVPDQVKPTVKAALNTAFDTSSGNIYYDPASSKWVGVGLDALPPVVKQSLNNLATQITQQSKDTPTLDKVVLAFKTGNGAGLSDGIVTKVKSELSSTADTVRNTLINTDQKENQLSRATALSNYNQRISDAVTPEYDAIKSALETPEGRAKLANDYPNMTKTLAALSDLDSQTQSRLIDNASKQADLDWTRANQSKIFDMKTRTLDYQNKQLDAQFAALANAPEEQKLGLIKMMLENQLVQSQIDLARSETLKAGAANNDAAAGRTLTLMDSLRGSFDKAMQNYQDAVNDQANGKGSAAAVAIAVQRVRQYHDQLADMHIYMDMPADLTEGTVQVQVPGTTPPYQGLFGHGGLLGIGIAHTPDNPNTIPVPLNGKFLNTKSGDQVQLGGSTLDYYINGNQGGN